VSTIERSDPASKPSRAKVEHLQGLEGLELLAALPRQFDPTKVVLACSFQKEESVLLDLLARSGALQAGVRVFALDTGVLFEETYELWRSFERTFDIEIEGFRGISLAEQAQRHGDALWARDPVACCGLRKVAPLSRALEGLDAWITGVRRDQSPSRANAATFEWDRGHDLWKANPLAGWTDKQVWAEIVARELPYNPLHDRGYASIGCTHCTQPGAGRAGRWAGQDKTECGIHVDG